MTLRQRVIVSALVRKEDAYLFISQNKKDGAYQGQLHIPGGGIEPGEDLEEAARREVREETGIEIQNIQPAHFDAAVLENYKGAPHQLVFLQYTADYKSGDVLPGSDAEECLWIHPEDFGRYNHNPATIRFLKALGLWEK